MQPNILCQKLSLIMLGIIFIDFLFFSLLLSFYLLIDCIACIATKTRQKEKFVSDK